jgi:RNA polymerase sigma factor (sigma-70 family)
MDENAWLAERFEANRSHLRGVAYRMLGSLSDADDAVQEAWIRLSRTDTGDINDLRAWLTTVVGRVCLNLLRSRKTRREVSLETHVPDPIVSPRERDIWGRRLGARWESICDPGPDGQGWEDRRDRHTRGSGAAWQAGSHRGRTLKALVLQASCGWRSHPRRLAGQLCSVGMIRLKRTQDKELRT